MKHTLRWYRVFAAALVMVLGVSSFLCNPAIAGTTGTITGTIRDAESGAPVANVRVTATAPSGSQSTTTNASGFYSMQALIPDTYTVSFEAQGYTSFAEPGVTVQQDINFKLDQSLHKTLKTIASVSARSAGNLVKGYTGTDVYNVSGQQLKVATGGDNLHKTVYEYLDTVPGVTPIAGGYPAEPSIHGGYDVDNGYELDGIPITERMTGFFTTNLTDLGISNVEVYTGGLSAQNAGNGLGIINTVVKTGTYPAFGSLNVGVTSPDFNHYVRAEYGGATPNHRFSYYLGFDGANSQNDYNAGAAAFNLVQTGISSSNPGYIYTRDFIGNFHYKPNQTNDFQFFYQNSLYNGAINYALNSGTQAAPLLSLAQCVGAAPSTTTVSGAAGGTSPTGAACPEGLYFKALQNGTGNFIGHYSGIGKVQWNHIINSHSSFALRLAENFNQYIFDQKLTDPNYAFENDPAGGTAVDSGCPQYPYANGQPLVESNGSECTFDLGDYYQSRYGNDYFLSLDYTSNPNPNFTFKAGAGQEYDNQRRDVRYLNLFNNPGNTNVYDPTNKSVTCGGLTFTYPCDNSYTDIPTHVPYAYVDLTFNAGKFTLEPGLRYSRIYYGVPKEFGGSINTDFLAPTFAGTYRANASNVFRFSYGTSGNFVNTEFVYRLGSFTYNPLNNGPDAYKPQVNHTADFQWEHQFDSSTSLRVGPYYRVTNNYLGSFAPVIGILPNGQPKYGDNVLTSGLKIRSFGAELGLSHENRQDTGISWWLSGSYNNYWTQTAEFLTATSTSGGQTSSFNQALSTYFLNQGIFVRGYQIPLVSGTFSTDIHSKGWHVLPVIYYTYDNFYNNGGCVKDGTQPSQNALPVSCTSSKATGSGATAHAPALAPEGIGPGYWYVNTTLLKELNSRYTVGVRVSNLTDNQKSPTPCWNGQTPGYPAGIGTGCFGLDGSRSGTFAPVGYIYPNLTQNPRTIEFFANIKM
ncbi:MAG: carboxypeptidase regulatory-like domain-containing protein [Vulcanimicrobiaceae bacterium]